METIDARGCACPEPVLMTQKAVALGQAAYTVLLDSPTAVENVSRFAAGAGFAVDVRETGEEYSLTLTKKT